MDFKNILAKTLWLFLGLVFLTASQAQVVVKQLSAWNTADKARLVFDLNKTAEYSLSVLHYPKRIVLDIKNARLALRLKPPKVQWVEQIQSATRNGKNVRVVLELKKTVYPKSFILLPSASYGHRLVVELYDKPSAMIQSAQTKANHPVKPFKSRKNSHSHVHSKVRVSTKSKPKFIAKSKLKPLIIAIDAGHGGKDPGAIGKDGTHEKTVVLSIAHRLARLINRSPYMQAVLIRQGDDYIGLRQRITKARQAQADLFISIHADAAQRRSAKGASVFVLSSKGASSEMARWLADKENVADLAYNIELSQYDDHVAKALLDMAQQGTLRQSQRLAEKILSQLNQVGVVHSPKVQRAGFRVLKSPDIPSILVETAFISNPLEEQQLKSSWFQKKMALAIFKGLEQYRKSQQLPATNVAKK